MFHHVYIEITNICQFQCSFCPKTTRPPRFLTLEEFEHILLQVKDHTNLIYLHVLGEPLIHPQLDAILTLAHKHGLTVNLTTNGYALKETSKILLSHHHIKKINISLHSMEDSGQQGKDIGQYLQEVTAFAAKATVQIPATIVYRLWNTSLEYDTMTAFLQNHYQPEFIIRHTPTPPNGLRLAYRIFLHQQDLFEWPIQASARTAPQNEAYCLGLKSHIAILSNGTVVPCCLDSEGNLALGNIFETDLNDILNSPRALAIKQGFQRHIAVEPQCQQCTYKDRFTNIG